MTGLKEDESYKSKKGYWQYTHDRIYYLGTKLQQAAIDFGVDTDRSIRNLQYIHELIGKILKEYDERTRTFPDPDDDNS